MSTSFNVQIISSTGTTIEVYGQGEGSPDTILGVLNQWFTMCQGLLDADKLIGCLKGLHKHSIPSHDAYTITNQYQGDYEYIVDFRDPEGPTLTIKNHEEYASWVKNEDRIIHPCTFIANSFRRSCQADGYADIFSTLLQLEERHNIALVEMED